MSLHQDDGKKTVYHKHKQAAGSNWPILITWEIVPLLLAWWRSHR